MKQRESRRAREREIERTHEREHTNASARAHGGGGRGAKEREQESELEQKKDSLRERDLDGLKKKARLGPLILFKIFDRRWKGVFGGLQCTF